MIYELSPVLDIKEYEGFGWTDRSASITGRRSLTMDFQPQVDPDGNKVPVALSNLWKPVRVKGSVQPWNDFPCIALDVPAFSKRAVESLWDLLEPNGELLPLVSDVGEYFAFNVTTIADVLDTTASDVAWGHEGKYASRINRYEFHSERLHHLSIFRLPEKVLDYYVSKSFRDRVKANKLQGFDLAKVWPLPKGVDWWAARMRRLKHWQAAASDRRASSDGNLNFPPIEPWRDV